MSDRGEADGLLGVVAPLHSQLLEGKGPWLWAGDQAWPLLSRHVSPSVHPANPLGILVANLLSPALVKKEKDIPLMVRELMRYMYTCVCLCVWCMCAWWAHMCIHVWCMCMHDGLIYTYMCVCVWCMCLHGELVYTYTCANVWCMCLHGGLVYTYTCASVWYVCGACVCTVGSHVHRCVCVCVVHVYARWAHMYIGVCGCVWCMCVHNGLTCA